MPRTVSDSRTRVSFNDTSVSFSSKSNAQLRKTYLLFALMHVEWATNLGTFFIKVALKLNLPIKSLIKYTIFEQFCGGENIKECEKTIQSLAKAKIGTILDYSIEGEDNEKSFDQTTAEILRTIVKAHGVASIPFTVFKVTGIASSELLEKIQNKTPLTDDQEKAYQRVCQRMNQLCGAAHEHNVKIFIDAEESWIQDTIDELTYGMMVKYNTQQPIVYNTYQFYRWEMLSNLEKATKCARHKGYFLGAKLVRGAYFEKERQRAHEFEYQDPIHATKADTDADFDKAIEFALSNRDVLSICLGTHNEESCQLCAELMDEKLIDHNDPHVWFAQLLGMSDNISYNLSQKGYNVAKYVPYGPVESVMPYLFRRADENKSIAGQSSREFLLVKNELDRRKKERISA